jgi:hypothetical protein
MRQHLSQVAHVEQRSADRAIAEMIGLGFGNAVGVEEELRAGALVLIPVRRWNVRKTMSIIRVRDAALTPSAEQFLIMLRARWGQTPSRRSPGRRRRYC